MANKQIKDYSTSASPLRTDQFLIQTDAGTTEKQTPNDFMQSINGDNTYLIEQESDFPVQDATTITLSTGLYNSNATIVTSKRLVIPAGANVFIRGTNAFYAGIVYTGTGNFISDEDFSSISFIETFISCPASGSSVFNIVPSTTKTGSIFFVRSSLVDCDNIGTIKNIDNVSIDFSAFTDIGSGIVFDSVRLIAILNTQSNSWKDQVTSHITVQGICEQFISNGFATKPESNETIFDFKSTLTIDTSSITASPVSLVNGGSVFASGSKDGSNVEFIVDGSKNIPPSQTKAELFITTPAATTFTAADTPLLCAGTWADSAERFTTTAAGRATYTGTENVTVEINWNPSSIAGSINQDVTYYISKGNLTTDTITAVTDQGGGTVRITTGNEHGISTLDERGNTQKVAIIGTTSYNGSYTITVIDSTNFDITATFVATETGNWQEIIGRSSSTNTIASTTKAGNTGVQTSVSIVTGDYIETFLENNSGTATITVNDSNLLISS